MKRPIRSNPKRVLVNVLGLNTWDGDLVPMANRVVGCLDWLNRILLDRYGVDGADTLSGSLARLENELHIRSKDAARDLPTPAEPAPLPLVLHCPSGGGRHIDGPDVPAHRTHACQACVFLWAPGVVPTVGVRFLPGCGPPEDA